MISITHMFVEIYFLTQAALIPIFIREFNLSLLQSSLIVTIPGLAQLLMNLPSGILTERLSTRQLLFASMLIEALSALLISQTKDFWMLVFGVSLMKVSSPLYHISGLSQISRFAKPEHMGRTVGFHNAFGSFGTAAGVISLGLFLSTLGWRWSYMFWSFPILLWGFMLLKSPQLKMERVEKTEVEKKEILAKLSLIFSAPLMSVLFAMGIRQVGATGISTFMTTYLVSARGVSMSIASLIFGLGPFIGIFGSLGGGYLTEKTGAMKTLNWTVLGCVLSLSVLSIMTQVYSIVLVYLVYAFFSNSIWSPVNTIIAAISPESERGLSYSIFFLTEG